VSCLTSILYNFSASSAKNDQISRSSIMKQKSKQIISSLINFGGKLIRFLKYRNGQPVKRVIVLSPSWEGSIGDEAVIKASTDYFTAELGYTVDLLTFDAGKPYRQAESISAHINIPQYFKTGGWLDRIRLTRTLANYDRFVLLGTDSLDGHYTEWQSNGLMTLAHQAAKSGMPTTVAGISMQEDPKPSCVAMLEMIAGCTGAKICVRDEVSKKRIEARIPSAILTADPAFLLDPTIDIENATHISDWIDERRQEGRLVIGVNISSHAIQTLGVSPPDSLETSFIKAICLFAKKYQQPLSTLIIPHDLRKHCDDLAICRAVAAKLNAEANCKTLVYEPPVTAAAVKGLVGKLDYVFSGRMHLAIATLGSGVPVGCVTYQGKFEGLFRHFGLDGLTITPDEALDSAKLAEFLERGILGRAALATAIAKKLPLVRQLAKENFS
jgi:polysaccharide pyruvyl transferase WcaK-like protein